MIEPQYPCYYPGEYSPPTKMHLNTVHWLLQKPEIAHVHIVIGKDVPGQPTQEQKAKLWELLLKSKFAPQASIIKSKENGPVSEIYETFNKKKTLPGFIALDEKASRNKKFQSRFECFPYYGIQLVPSQYYKSSKSVMDAIQSGDDNVIRTNLPEDFTEEMIEAYIKILKAPEPSEVQSKPIHINNYKEQYTKMFDDGFWKSVFQPMSDTVEINEELNEEIKAGTFRGYHRSKIDEPTKFNTGFRPGGGAGAMYGPGIYMTYELEDQLNSGMEGYGPTIVEYEVKNNGKFLIYDKSEALKVFGSNPTLIKQLKKILGGNFTNFYKENKDEIDKYNDSLASGSYGSSSDIAYSMSQISNIETYVDGIVFSGRQDARVLAVFNTNIANPIRYTKDDGKTWISMKDKTSHKIGRDERGDSKILNFIKIGGKGDFNKLSDKDKRKVKDYMVEKYGDKAKYMLYHEDLKPEDLDVKGDLDLSYIPIESLPDNLKVGGALYLRDTPIESLPDNLQVRGDLNLRGATIKSLPDNLQVGGDLNLIDTPIESLPNNLKVGGYLYLRDTPIESLPDNLQVDGDLDLSDTSIESLPDNLQVGGSIYLNNCKNLKSLPDNLKVGWGLELRHTPIESLPDNLQVDGYLDLTDTPIESLPDNLQVGMDLYGSDEIEKQWEEIKAKRKQNELQENDLQKPTSSSFTLSQLDEEGIDNLYNTFKTAYESTTGSSWDKDKFLGRARNWVFYGNSEGFVAVRPQNSGYMKLVGVAGSLKSILEGLNSLILSNLPVWGMVSKDIQKMLNKKGFKTPNLIVMNILLRMIPKSVFGGVDYKVNLDGSLTLNYEDTGAATKYFVANDEYYSQLKRQVASGALDAVPGIDDNQKETVKKFLGLNEGLNEEIKAGTFRGYHRSKIDEPTKFNTGFRPGGGAGALYGPGIYMTYELKDQLNPGMEGYGSTIVEYEVKNNGKFLIYDKSEALKVFGSNPTLVKQLKKILGGNFTNFYKENKDEIDKYNDSLASGSYGSSSEIAYSMSQIPNIETYVDGIIFTGQQDSRVLAVFNTNIANPIRYTKDDGKTWVSLKDKTSHKIGRDKRGSSKAINFLNISGKIDFNNLSDEEKEELKDDIIEKYGDRAKYTIYHEELSPEDLNVDGSLDLSEIPIKSLPDNLRVGGDLFLDSTSIKSLPDNLQVGGDLDLSGTRIKSIPDNLQVRGSLSLSRTLIKTIPDNLQVGEGLYLSGTNIKSLPDNLKLGGDLYLDGTKIDYLPDNLKVGGTLGLSGTPIKSLPDDLQVDGGVYGSPELMKQWEEIKAKRNQK